MNRPTNDPPPPFGPGRTRCRLERCLDVVSGAWTLRILWCLLDGQPHRFSEIERRIAGISAKVLARKLRDLERHQIIQRHALGSAIPHVEYQLTKRGRAFEPIFQAMEQAAQQLFPDPGESGETEAVSPIEESDLFKPHSKPPLEPRQKPVQAF